MPKLSIKPGPGGQGYSVVDAGGRLYMHGTRAAAESYLKWKGKKVSVSAVTRKAARGKTITAKDIIGGR